MCVGEGSEEKVLTWVRGGGGKRDKDEIFWSPSETEASRKKSSVLLPLRVMRRIHRNLTVLSLWISLALAVGAKTITRTALIAVLILRQRAYGVTTSTSSLNLESNFASARPWTWRVSGLSGAVPITVRRLTQTSCRRDGKDRLLVAFTSHELWSPNKQYPDQNLFDESTMGHLAEIEIDSAGVATLISDQALRYCSEMGDVTASPDCSIIGVLCRSPLEPWEINASDWMKITDPVRYRRRLHLYLLTAN